MNQSTNPSNNQPMKDEKTGKMRAQKVDLLIGLGEDWMKTARIMVKQGTYPKGIEKIEVESNDKIVNINNQLFFISPW